MRGVASQVGAAKESCGSYDYTRNRGDAMKYVGIGIGAAIIAVAIFLGVHQARQIERLEKTVQDTTSSLNTKFKHELSLCWSKVAQQETIRVPIATVFRKLSARDSVRIASFIEFANQGKLDSLLAVITRLSTPKWGSTEFTYESENLKVTGYAYADHYPLESDTMNVVARISDVQILSLPRDTVVTSTTEECSKPFIGRTILLTDWKFIPKDKKSEFGLSVGFPINIGSITIMPNAGMHSLVKLNAGVLVAVEF